jgi:hypothetical protein
MQAKNGNKPLWLSILCWAARIVAILFIVFIPLLFIGEGGIWKHSAGTRPSQVKDYMLFLLVVLYLGSLIIGMWRNGLGGFLSLVFIIALMAILALAGMKNLTYFYIMLLPSLLYIIPWCFHRRFERQKKTNGSIISNE